MKSLIEIHSYRSLNKSLSRIADALERIADTSEGHFRKRVFSQPGAPDEAELLNQTDEEFWEIEQQELKMTALTGVAPGVEADLVAMLQAAKDGRE